MTAMASPRAGEAQTVLGPIAADTMGITLPHEHLLIDFEVMFREPASASERGLAYQPVSMENLGWVRHNFSSNLDNLRLLDEGVARDEALLFKNAGGRTLVDPTNRSLARDPLALARVARATGLNIIMGSGYYVAAAHPPDMDTRTTDAITREIVADLTVGVDSTGIRAGFIGREALGAQRQRGVTRRLLLFALDDTPLMAWGEEPIYRDGACVGVLTSVGFGHTVGRLVGMGYVPLVAGERPESLLTARWEIDVEGTRVIATPSLRAWHDATGARMKG